MSLGNLLRRAGSASPLVPALTYGGVLSVANLLLGLAPNNVVVALLSLLAWVAAGLFLFVVVTWYRDDDWLAAGFLLGLSVVLGALVADVIARVVATGSVGEAVFVGASASMALLVRAVIFVPVCGGVVTVARWATRVIRKRGASAPPV
jgi:hypothetical protein